MTRRNTASPKRKRYPYAVKPTEQRGPEPIAWRFWPVSYDAVTPDLYQEIVNLNLKHNMALIGYGDFPLVDTSSEFHDFATDTGWNVNQRGIAYQFTWQTRRGDMILLCRDTGFVIAWGLLRDDRPRFLDDDDPRWRTIRRVRDRLWKRGPREQLRNYHRVDRWRLVNLPPWRNDARLPGAPSPTVMPYREVSVLNWLRLRASDLKLARVSLKENEDSRDDEQAEHPVTKSNGRGRMQDQGRREAVELHAMRLAQLYYEREGYTVEDTSATEPYDLQCEKGGDIRLVEVKGTTLAGSTVELTAGEVESAREYVTDLFVVSDIECIGHGEEARATGGNCRVFRDWDPEGDDLEPTAYRYAVPNGGRAVRVAEPVTNGEDE